MDRVEIARTKEQIEACFPVMVQLRPHLDIQDFVSRVSLQVSSGYQLAFVRPDDKVVAVAGFRISENLAWGRFLYVDDLVTDEVRRSAGYGKQLLAWLCEEAKANACEQLHLDSGMQREDAHRFYKREKMEVTGFHFAIRF